MNRIRVVVADQAEAIFYDITSLKGRPVEVSRLADPDARQYPPGLQLQARNFARAIAANLDADRRSRQFQQLIVVASAPFRSLMRAEFSDATKAAVVYEVPKDLVHSHVEVLSDYLPTSAQELKSA